MAVTKPSRGDRGNEDVDIKSQKQLQVRERTIWVEDAEDGSEG